jgi:hypothetical protein
MSTPSRRSEIRRRRTRTEKINQLRKRYAAAKNDAERTKLTDKLKKVSIGLSLEHFVKPIEARKARTA